MRIIRKFVFFSLTLLTSLSCAVAQKHEPSRIAITNVTVIDVVAGQSLPAMTVVINGERIEAIGKHGQQPVSKGARAIDGTGKFLIPGLWDMHTHFTSDQSTLDLFLAHGITGVRDMGSIALRRTGNKVDYLPRDEAIKEIVQTRDEVLSGKLLGPRIFTGGMIVTGPNPNNPSAPAAPHQIVVRTEAEARSTVNRLADMRVDFIKVHARLSRETFLAIIDESKKRRVPVVGHVPLSIDPMIVSQAGQKSIEHLTGVWEYAHKGMPTSGGMDPKRFKTEIDEFRKNGTWQVPTLVSYLAGAEAYRIANNPDSEPALDYVVPELVLRWKGDWSLSEFTPEQSKGFRDSVKILEEMTAELRKGGVGILAGSDFAGIFTYAGESLHKELELLNQAGLTPMETLQTATIRPAEFLGIDKDTGSITRGKAADLVLLRSDPLQDIRNARAIEAVFVRGQLLNRKRLDLLLKKVAERAKPSRQMMKTLPWAAPGS
ncbi:MAG TPA: amidohydrolase family protein [Pyrinomonadaceae bacterium]|nr:amidohydrolase family protein [Pyrinomonadaceae bacterium]